MKIIIDLQACQSLSRFRGIGRYSHDLFKELARKLLYEEHELTILLNQDLPHSHLSDLFLEFYEKRGFAIEYFKILSPCSADDKKNSFRRLASEVMREHFIADLHPDVVLNTTFLVDGWSDDTTSSIGSSSKAFTNFIIHYDFIPLAMPYAYLPEGEYKNFYMEKVAFLKKADHLLAISNYSSDEAIKFLQLNDDKISTISFGLDEEKFEKKIDSNFISKTILKYRVQEKFFLYAPGGFDYRKNIANLLKAFALFKSEASESFQLVITGIMSDAENKICQEFLTAVNLTNEDVIFTNYISDDELIALYKSTFLYIFPSLMEGCGLSVIEAMASGAPVIGSNCASVPEVIGNNDYTFDPNDPVSIKNQINLAVKDSSFYKKLKMHSANNYKKFSWQNVASNICDALKSHVKTPKYNEKTDFRSLLNEVEIRYQPYSIQSKEIDMLQEVFAINFNG